MKGFRDEAEFRRVFERVFELMNETPAVGASCATPTHRTASSSPTWGSSST